MDEMKERREFLKAGPWEQWDVLERDQMKDIPMPLRQKPYPEDAVLIDLVLHKDITIGCMPLIEVINQRRSRRKFTDGWLSKEELSFLLWATQGNNDSNIARRTVPSGGARHPFETYLIINRVEGIEPGLYTYLPLEHKLLFIRKEQGLAERVAAVCQEQEFMSEGAVIFAWTAVPYRTEWRYSILSHKIIAVDAGHLCQNLYLASEAIGAGTCAIGAYRQEEMDEILNVDGENEFTVYVAPVGKV